MTTDSSATKRSRCTRRRLQDDNDVAHIRSVLAQSYAHTPLGFNWDVRRWDGQRFYQPGAALNLEWAARVQVWLHEDTIVAAVCLEGEPGNEWTINLLIDPAWRTLESAMVAWGESTIAARDTSPATRVEISVGNDDIARQLLLTARGYQPTAHTGVIRRLHFGSRHWSPPHIAPGYMLRATHPCEGQCQQTDCQAIADLLNAAFNRDFHNAAEYHTFTQHAPSFRRDLDLVAVAPDGTLAAYVGIPYDAHNNLGIFEPVCTHPAHRRLGLAQSLMTEGLIRLKALGAASVIVETGDAVPANRLYESMGFDETARSTIWQRTISRK